MSTVSHTSPDAPPNTELPRAGFWRRWLGILIDAAVVLIPFQIIGAVLFATSAGTVQLDTGFYHACETGTSIPQGLDPPPPHDSNFMSVCRFSFFGATTGAILTVARVSRSGNTTSTVSQGYMLDRDGKPVRGTSIDWIYQLAFLVYLITLMSKTGRTLGSRVTGTTLIATANPGARGIPIGKTMVRYLAMFIGAVPALALLLYAFITKGGTADQVFAPEFSNWFIGALLIGALWTLVLIVQIVRKRDPYYDRLAGTAMIKTAAKS